MQEVAKGVWQITLMPRHGVNSWLLGDVVVDAGYGFQAKKLVQALQGRAVTAHTITHAHLDHAGGSDRVCRELGVPFWCPAKDVGAARSGVMEGHQGINKKVAERMKFAPVSTVDRELNEGDEVAGFRVLDVPGHSPGHVAFWRESDRTLVAGDVFFNISLLTGRYGLRPPPGSLTPDPARNRESMRRLADLEPSVACFGHGPPVTDAAPKLRAAVAKL